MDKKQAISILVNVANLAQQKGILSLEEAVTVYQAIHVATKEGTVEEKSIPEQDNTEEVKSKKLPLGKKILEK